MHSYGTDIDDTLLATMAVVVTDEVAAPGRPAGPECRWLGRQGGRTSYPYASMSPVPHTIPVPVAFLGQDCPSSPLCYGRGYEAFQVTLGHV